MAQYDPQYNERRLSMKMRSADKKINKLQRDTINYILRRETTINRDTNLEPTTYNPQLIAATQREREVTEPTNLCPTPVRVPSMATKSGPAAYEAHVSDNYISTITETIRQTVIEAWPEYAAMSISQLRDIITFYPS